MGKHAGSFKVTYSTMNAELLEEFHQQFDVALAKVKKEIGSEHQNWVNGEKIKTESSKETVSYTHLRAHET